MSVILNNPEPQEPIVNDGFFPDINPAEFKKSMRIDAGICESTMRHQILIAIHQVNMALVEFKAAHIEVDTFTLAEVDAPDLDGKSTLVIDYQEAVYSRAKALMFETYADTDTTVLASTDTEQKSNSANEYKRRSYEAIQRIAGEARASIELI